MGGGAYTYESYQERVEERKEKKVDTFQHSIDVQRGFDNEGQRVERKVHPTLDITGKVRESCDFEGKPSLAIAFFLDVTGSMQDVPVVMQKCLPNAMRLLIEHKYTREAPQVLFGAFADSHGDEFPIQVGQFEADIRMEDGLVSIVIGGGGGGRDAVYSHESYGLPIFVLGMRTEIDCYKKRKKKGYAFIFGDELPYDRITAQEQEKYLGIRGEDVPIEVAVKAAKEKYNLFYIIPGGTMHAGESTLIDRWSTLLGDERVNIGAGRTKRMVSPFVIQLDKAELAAEATCLLVGLSEGTVPNLEDGLAHLQANETDKNSIRQALMGFATYVAQQRQ